MLLIADPKILAVPVQENHEKMVDLRDSPEIKTDEYYYAKAFNIKHNKHTFVRESVATMLVEAQSCMPKGWHLKLWEGHRSEKYQQLLFDTIYELRRSEFPELSDEEIFNKTLELVSPVRNFDGSKNIPPHGVGGAVDVYIVDDKGVEIEMGIFPEQDLSVDPETCQTASKKVPEEFQDNRRILCEVMEKVGFVNYPFEWWHFSYGDRYWAYTKNKEFAIYDLIQVG